MTITTKEHVKEKARTAYILGQPREANPFNWSAFPGAYQDWNAEYDRLAEEAKQDALES